MVKVEDDMGHSIFSKEELESNGRGGSWAFVIQSTGHIGIKVSDGKPTKIGNAQLNDGQWHHFAMSYSPNGGLCFYCDGQLDGEM